MKRVALALADLTRRIAGGVGLEGTFLIAGTALLAAGASFIGPAAAISVIGIMCILAWIALTVAPGGRP